MVLFAVRPSPRRDVWFGFTEEQADGKVQVERVETVKRGIPQREMTLDVVPRMIPRGAARVCTSDAGAWHAPTLWDGRGSRLGRP